MPISDENTRRKLFISPGLDGSGFGLRPFCDALKSDFDVTVLQLPNTESDYERLAEWALSQITSASSFYLLGESFSGPLAIKVAARCGRRVRGLILCATFAHSPVHASAGLRRIVSMLPSMTPPMSVLSAMLFDRHSSAKWRDEFTATIRAQNVTVAKARVLQALAVDVRSVLSTIESKVLVLQATQDRLLRAGASAEIHEIKIDSSLERIDGPHFLLQTCSDQCVAAIKKYFA
jgi:pimeloyl-[acyl-carrier protein] methyl ester esterase